MIPSDDRDKFLADSGTALFNGNELLVKGAFETPGGVHLLTGYPGSPVATFFDILGKLRDILREKGVCAHIANNEAVSIAMVNGTQMAPLRAMTVFKSVGGHVASDGLALGNLAGAHPQGGAVVVFGDDPWSDSTQVPADSRYLCQHLRMFVLEPSTCQEVKDFVPLAFRLSQASGLYAGYIMTTTLADGGASVRLGPNHWPEQSMNNPGLIRTDTLDPENTVLLPPRTGKKEVGMPERVERLLAEAEQAGVNVQVGPAGKAKVGFVTCGVAWQHLRAALSELGLADKFPILKLGMTYPLPMERIRLFVGTVQRCVVIEEGDPYLVEAIRAAGIAVEGKPEMYRYGELSVERVRRILAGDTSPEPVPPRGKPPQLCRGCPHRTAFTVLNKLGCIVSGDIGCYTLGVLPPFEAMDTCVCMGASITVGLGLRHTLPAEQARRVVSVIGDSTFMHSGITGLVEMVYNPPPQGHVVLVLDNGTTAMTGLQEHPGTGRMLNHEPTGKVSIEALARSLGITNVRVLDPAADPAGFEEALRQALDAEKLTLLVARRPCLLAAGKIREYEKTAELQRSGCDCQAAGNDQVSAGGATQT